VRAFWQLLVLAYQNMDKEELTAVIGREPRLTPELLAKFRVTFSYDVRAGDGEYIERPGEMDNADSVNGRRHGHELGETFEPVAALH
jgi:hypothetical protein